MTDRMAETAASAWQEAHRAIAAAFELDMAELLLEIQELFPKIQALTEVGFERESDLLYMGFGGAIIEGVELPASALSRDDSDHLQDLLNEHLGTSFPSGYLTDVLARHLDGDRILWINRS